MALVLKIICVSICATILMTTFSYMASYLAKKNYREPELINCVFKNANLFPFNLDKNSLFGWVIHFLSGIAFTAIAFGLLDFFQWKLNGRFGLIYGAAAGLVGILIWMLLFRKFGFTLQYPRSQYFTQLFIAHLLFGLSISLLIPLF